ncbi:MAG: NAD(P)/FAD-dependent oxidoreductase [Pseudomonadota bacterium]
MAIETDYLIIGAGASCLAFADEMLTQSDAHMTIVDKRHAPGGHWNDAYPFVRLHQPSTFYGVESKELSDGAIDESGVNAGNMSLSEGSEILHYFHSIMKERLLPSGRVSYYPLSEVTEDRKIRSLLSGEVEDVFVRKKVVDASYHENAVPRTHTRKFKVAEGVTCAPPNDLPRLAAKADHFTVLGAGKTGIDACVWLLTHGADPKKMSWVVPRDPWLINRATTQPHDKFFEDVFGGFVRRQEAIATATSPTDFAHKMEEAGIWLRIDPNVEPGFYHAATVSHLELEAVRKIGDIIRMGRLQEIQKDKLILDQGEKATQPNTLYVDCTASAIEKKPTKPIFDGDVITLQMIRFPQVSFNAALTAFLEANFEDEETKQSMAAPVPLPDSVEDYVRSLQPDMMNRYNAARNSLVRNWCGESRLDGFAKIAREASEGRPDRQALLKQIRDTSFAAVANLPNILAAAET